MTDIVERAIRRIGLGLSLDREEGVALVVEIERLREALRFYASPYRWCVDGTFTAPSPHSDHRPDGGDTARAALGDER
jgi:hypothetical protein